MPAATLFPCGRLKKCPSQDIQVLISGSCDCYLMAKKDIAHGNELRFLRWQFSLGYPKGSHMFPYKKEAREDLIREGDVTVEAEIEV